MGVFCNHQPPSPRLRLAMVVANSSVKVEVIFLTTSLRPLSSSVKVEVIFLTTSLRPLSGLNKEF
jgi:hypothetical protein